ncbi:YncE family protein, partial [Streptomyces spiralis]
WSCTLATLTCTRSDILPAGGNYPPITLKVKIDCHTRGKVTNTATVTGGGDTTTHTATDTTTIHGCKTHGYGDDDGYGYGYGHDQCHRNHK